MHMVVKNSGFTLAEVLIALGIIGILAVISVPILLQKTTNKELVSAYLKTLSDFSQAFKYADVNNSLTKLEEDNFKNVFVSYLNTVNCENHSVCLTSGVTFDWGNFFDPTCSTVANGTSFALEHSCIALIVDVNGNKYPNKPGRDIFKIWLTKQGAFPEGDAISCSGLDCGAYVLSHQKLYNLDIIDK